jgi:glycosyltransferase involved in cell wall biosynthesis
MTSVIVATYNRARVLRRLLASLRLAGECESGEWEIIVVDNNSSDDTG